jgi:hypothetical protein
MRIGYARVSTIDQNPDLQEDALQKVTGKNRGATPPSHRTCLPFLDTNAIA